MLRIGHRGAAGHALENTVAAVRYALACGVDLVEIDVQELKDGSLVVFHDKLLDRLSATTGYLADFSLSDLNERVTIGSFEKIPTLGEVCNEVKGSAARLMIEIVSFGCELKAVAEALSVLPVAQLVFASFCHSCIVNVKHANSNIETMALIEGVPIDLEAIINDTRCNYIGFGFESIDTSAIRLAQQLGVKVLVWTVDDPREIARARGLGVDGIISNFPELIMV
jgi:glycerophosphoryl diester phosphodiesterase